MKKALPCLIMIAIFTALVYVFSQEFTYVEADQCKVCHTAENIGKQFPLWESSLHSQAFELLDSKKAFDTAIHNGVRDLPTESRECLKCHAPLYENSEELKQEGVTCEVCHGPGSAYKSLYRMKIREEAIKYGLTEYNSPEEIRKSCVECHGNEGFDFKSAWEIIKHPVPVNEKD